MAQLDLEALQQSIDPNINMDMFSGFSMPGEDSLFLPDGPHEMVQQTFPSFAALDDARVPDLTLEETIESTEPSITPTTDHQSDVNGKQICYGMVSASHTVFAPVIVYSQLAQTAIALQ